MPRSQHDFEVHMPCNCVWLNPQKSFKRFSHSKETCYRIHVCIHLAVVCVANDALRCVSLSRITFLFPRMTSSWSQQHCQVYPHPLVLPRHNEMLKLTEHWVEPENEAVRMWQKHLYTVTVSTVSVLPLIHHSISFQYVHLYTHNTYCVIK